MAVYSREYTPSTAALDFTSLVAVRPSSAELKRAVNADAAFSGDAIDGVNVIPDASPNARVDFVKGSAFSGGQQTAIDAIAAAHTGTGPLELGGTRPMGDDQPRAPTADDDETRGFSFGSIFIDTSVSPKRAYLCTNPAAGAAEWQDVGNAFSGGEQFKVTSNDTTAGYAASKIVAGTDIDVVEVNDGGNETLRIDWTGSGSGITASAHNALRQLIHFIDEGPTDGFASGSYSESSFTGARLDSVIWYVDNTKVDKIVEFNALTFNGIFPLTEEWKMYDTDGSTVLITLLDTITYNGAFEATRTRTWS